MSPGDWVYTPRFEKVRIEAVYENYHECYRRGFNVPTHFRDDVWGVIGKIIATDTIIFAAYRK